MPLGGSVLIDRARVFDMVDKMRVASPEPLLIDGGMPPSFDTNIATDAEGLRRSEAEARLQLARAEEEVSRLRRELDTRVSGEEVTRIAEERGRAALVEAEEESRRILDDARMRAGDELAQAARVAQQQMEEADGYALQLLQRLDEQISLFLENVRSGVAQLDTKHGSSATRGGGRGRAAAKTEPAVDDEDDEDDDIADADDGDDAIEGSTRRFPWLRDD